MRKGRGSTDLVCADNHSLHTGSSVQGRDSHQSDDGGAVGVCDDTPLTRLHALHGLRIDFWDDQWNALLHTECRAIVYYLQKALSSSKYHLLVSFWARIECHSNKIMCRERFFVLDFVLYLPLQLSVQVFYFILVWLSYTSFRNRPVFLSLQPFLCTMSS